jgi:phospholipid/cholesterol/gamma-HCH transport system substrate-binding protein
VSKSREALVGVVIVAGVVVTAIGTLWLQGASFARNQQDLEAVFYEVGLIRAGNDLKLRGVQVGSVQEIVVDSTGNTVRVRFRIDEGIALPPDPVVILSPESLFGDWQAEIHPRTRYPNVAYAEPVEDGVLPGHALPDISQLTHMADQIAGNLATLTDRVGIAFSEETAENIASLIDNVEDVTQRLSDMVSQQATSFTEVTDGVQRAAQEFGAAAEQARLTFARADEALATGDLASTLEDLGVIAENLRQLSGELHGTNASVRSVAARVDSTFVRVDEIVARTAAGEGSLGRLLQDPAMANEMEGLMEELRALLVDIRENPRRYVRLSIF